MTEVERSWFRPPLVGEAVAPLYYSDDNEDGDFDDVDEADVAADFAAYRAELENCRRLAYEHPHVDSIGRRRRRGMHEVSLRWIYLYMIQEYARHNGTPTASAGASTASPGT